MIEHQLQQKIEDLLYILCVEYGFCLRADYYLAISKSKSYNAHDFVQDIFLVARASERSRQHFEQKFIDLFNQSFGHKVSFWQRQFLSKKITRLNKVSRKGFILLEYARAERSSKINIDKFNTTEYFKGKRNLKIARRKYIKAN